MSKIAKLIRSALNNSSANEAAQALKIAAATMQKEGINPADFLQEKGEQQPERPDNSAELREAKELAIKWHRVAQAQEQQLAELAPIAVAAQEKVASLTEDKRILKNWVRIFGVGGVVAALFCWGVGMSNGEDNGRALQANANWSQLAAKDSEISNLKGRLEALEAAPANQVIDNLAASNPAPTTDNNTAICTIQGINEYGVQVRFTYKNSKVGVWMKGAKTNGKWQDVTAEAAKSADPLPKDYTRSQFLKDVNAQFPSKTDCRLK